MIDETARDLLTRSAQCRALASKMEDRASAATLTAMAEECEEKAAALPPKDVAEE
ncbi:hypothetical protein G7077_02160 [Sphingomonas piscis]|uniref:Uncharacterized protein n=1 Tax=Sphingomonas piscis TaxID=2714943 RepID=A0A6G7YMF3_9SPHN|nr:hypothetical protein [Sphingomonas piscis]QIK77896.1 hypothetical protein G7077_02160 [Sphingomonas piscis]